jgi:hypothetical protein
MPVTSPAWLPSEFTEITSALMLKAPVKQFLYANMVYMADAQAQLRADPSSFEWVSGRGVPATAGGAPVPPLESMQLMLADNIRGEVIITSDELANAPGSVVKINRPVFTGGGYTFAQRAVGSGQTMSTTPISLTGEQVPITINRYSGPFAAGGTVPQPYGIDRFQAMQSVHSLSAKVAQYLQYDRDALLDNGIATLIDNPASGAVLYPGDPNNTLSSDASAFITDGDRTFDYETIMRAVAFLQSQNIPTFADGMYRMVINPAQAKQLSLDPVYRSEAKMLVNAPDPRNPILNSWVANIGRVVEVYSSTSNVVDTSTVSGVTINHAVMFGPQIVGRVRDKEGVRIALSSDDNYGETAKAMWIAYEGYAMMNQQFMVAIHSD